MPIVALWRVFGDVVSLVQVWGIQGYFQPFAEDRSWVARSVITDIARSTPAAGLISGGKPSPVVALEPFLFNKHTCVLDLFGDQVAPTMSLCQVQTVELHPA